MNPQAFHDSYRDDLLKHRAEDPRRDTHDSTPASRRPPSRRARRSSIHDAAAQEPEASAQQRGRKERSRLPARALAQSWHSPEVDGEDSAHVHDRDGHETQCRTECETRRAAGAISATPAGAVVSHPDRIVAPEDGITKRGLAEYYVALAPALWPHLQAGRCRCCARSPPRP
jgi:hypothetical protein